MLGGTHYVLLPDEDTLCSLAQEAVRSGDVFEVGHGVAFVALRHKGLHDFLGGVHWVILRDEGVWCLFAQEMKMSNG